VAVIDGLVGMRDSKLAASAVLAFSTEEWRAFVEGVRRGEFD
jgi:hypothetical protein